MRLCSIFCLAAIVLGSAIVGVRAQDPMKVAPESYRLQFENGAVRVLRVRYAPHSKVPTHDHSRFPAAYVYLTDAGPINFTHTGWDHPVLTRPATKAGSFRLSPTRFEDETHAVENRGDVASEFLRIELKTEAPDRKSLVGRFPPFSGDRGKGADKLEFENQQLRVRRLIGRPGEPVVVSAAADAPALVVVLSGGGETGRTLWIAAGAREEFQVKNRSEQIEILRFDLKTGPKP